MKKSTPNERDTLAINTVEYGEKINFGWLSKMKVLPLGMGAFAILLAAVLVYIDYSSTLDKNLQKTSHVSELLQLGERVEKSAILIKEANLKSFVDIEISKDRIEKLINVVGNGGKVDEINTSIDILSAKYYNTFTILKTKWDSDKKLIDSLLVQKVELSKLRENLDAIEKNSKVLDANVNELQRKTNLFEKYKATGGDLGLLVNRINQGFDSVLSNNYTVEKGSLLLKDLQYFNSIVNSTINNNINIEEDSSVIATLKEIQKAYVPYSAIIEPLSKNLTVLEKTKATTTEIIKLTSDISKQAELLNKEFIQETTSLSLNRWLAVSLFVIALSGFGLLAMVFYERSLQALRFAKVLEKNQANEIAINILISQMEPLDEGDFTNKVFVDDKFVSPIAQKVDNTREIFASIVRKIKFTAKEIQKAISQTSKSSDSLINVFDEQYNKLEKTIAVISSIASSMDEVAQATWIAQTNSNESIEASKNGGILVQESIRKMSNIRTTIQDSSKKIKKSSESAQAITEVTGLIKNITKQIEVLALNAAIQAASAGEAGRGFTVVAEEVQRLALDSKDATNTILELVKEVQEDIGSAVISMEKTTQEVVEQEKTNQKAGDALKRIEELSEKVSSDVEESANKLNEKSTDMANVSVEMKNLQDISKKTKEEIALTSQGITALNKTSSELENLVHDYRVKD